MKTKKAPKKLGKLSFQSTGPQYQHTRPLRCSLFFRRAELAYQKAPKRTTVLMLILVCFQLFLFPLLALRVRLLTHR